MSRLRPDSWLSPHRLYFTESSLVLRGPKCYPWVTKRTETASTGGQLNLIKNRGVPIRFRIPRRRRFVAQIAANLGHTVLAGATANWAKRFSEKVIDARFFEAVNGAQQS